MSSKGWFDTMHEIELGRLRRGDEFRLPAVIVVDRHFGDSFCCHQDGIQVNNWKRYLSGDLTIEKDTRVLIDDATMERVMEREAKNAASAAE